MNLQKFKLDAELRAFLDRELVKVQAQAYEIEVPVNRVRNFFGPYTGVTPGTRVFTYKVFSRVGMAKIVAGYSDDLPRADLYAREEVGRVRVLGNSYGYNI